jgi:hypothetical protein
MVFLIRSVQYSFIASLKYQLKLLFMQTRFRSTAIIKTALTILLVSALLSCKKESNPENGPYNLDVVLLGQDNKVSSSGFVKFRQDPDTTRIITLDTRVSKLEPNHSYLLQRAVNPITDNSCTSTAWLTLGNGLQPQAIHTDPYGNGEANLWRDVTSIPRGTAFRIHFQVVDAVSLTPVLTSSCYEYAVR